MTNEIKIGTTFIIEHSGMTVTSSNSTVMETWEVVDILDNGYQCQLRSSNAVMEVNQNYGKFFDKQTIVNSMNIWKPSKN